ncbi:MerR family DNA-binding transcriptional regulator [Elusimicrobiota bacterium]
MPKKIKDYITISQAAKLVGVSPSTLRNWDRDGKLEATIQPISGYRLYPCISRFYSQQSFELILLTI